MNPRIERPKSALNPLVQAQGLSAPRSIPEPRSVFTVKLPLRLMQQVRQTARQQKRTISDWVAEALHQHLERGPAHG